MKKRQMEKIWLFSLVALVLLVVGILGIRSVYASLTAVDKKSNEFQLSNLSGTVDEDFVPPIPTNPMRPGMTYPKKVVVKNSSATPLFTRVLVTPEIEAADGTLLPSNIGKEIAVDLGKNWLLGEDGYYYYLGKLAQNQASTALFTTVTLASNVSDQYIDATMKIYVKSETILTKGTHYRDAWWLGNVPTETNLKTVDTTLQILSH